MLPSPFVMADPRGYRSQSRLCSRAFVSPTSLSVKLSDKTTEARAGAATCLELGWRQRGYTVRARTLAS